MATCTPSLASPIEMSFVQTLIPFRCKGVIQMFILTLMFPWSLRERESQESFVLVVKSQGYLRQKLRKVEFKSSEVLDNSKDNGIPIYICIVI